MPAVEPAPSKYPPNARIVCACGVAGSVNAVTMHRNGGRNPKCKEAEPIVIGEVPPSPPRTSLPKIAPEDMPPRPRPGAPVAARAAAPLPAPEPAEPTPAPAAAAAAEAPVEEWIDNPRAGNDPQAPPGYVRRTIRCSIEVLALFEIARSELKFEGDLSDLINESIPEFFDQNVGTLRFVRHVATAAAAEGS